MALCDLDEIWEFIAQDNPSAARKVVSRILDAIDTITESPGIGPRREELAPGLRSFPVKPYVIFY